MENKSICNCGHTREHHVDADKKSTVFPCYECLGLYMKDASDNDIPLSGRHGICSDFKQDNLNFLEEKYERLSKRVS